MSSIMSKQVDTVNQIAPAAEDDLLEVLHGLMHQLRARHLSSGDETDLAIGPMERKALKFFSHHPGSTQSELVNHSGRDKGQLARLIAGLKTRGLLQARPDEKDRRVIRLYPTEQAQALYQQVQRQRKALSAKALAGLTQAQKSQLLTLLQLVGRNLQALDD